MPSIAKKHLSAPALLKSVRQSFKTVKDHRQSGSVAIPLVDALMSGLAVFAMKHPSLLKFDEQRNEPVIRSNLRSLYGVEQAPCDTQLRDIADPVHPESLYPAYDALFKQVQKGGVLEEYRFLDGHYLVSMDGTGHFASSSINCPECCVKEHRNGDVSYYHQLLSAVIVHPDRSNVFPFAPEAIVKADGATKNDCERNAAKRLLARIRKTYPHLPLIVVQDALFATGPHIKLLKSLDIRFILVVKEGDHPTLFETIQANYEQEQMQGYSYYDEKEKATFVLRFVPGVPLNKSHPELLVNYLEQTKVIAGEEQILWTWVTDLQLTEETCHDVMRGGRSRWKVENETFNTLKTQGYHLEHNYGHGQQHLATVFVLLMMLAFFIDQIQESGCRFFQQARRRFRSRTSLWERMRALFTTYYIDDWMLFWQAIIRGHKASKLCPDDPEFLRSG
jgi:Transposase DDE domain